MKAIRPNLPEKALAVVLAVFLWAAARSQQEAVPRVWEKPLQRRGLPRNLVEIDGPEKVRFHVTAPEEELQHLRDTIVPYVDLAGAKPGTNTYEIRYELSGSFRVERIELRPPQARFELDELVSRKIGVQVTVTARLGEGYEIAARDADPAEVRLSGRKSLVDQVVGALAEVDVADPAAPIMPVPLVAVNAEGIPIGDITLRPDSVTVRLAFEEQLDSAEVPVRERVVGRVAEGARYVAVRLSPSSVTLTGRADLLRDVREISTELVSLSGLTNTTDRTVALVVPAGFRASPREVTARIVVEPPKASTPPPAVPEGATEVESPGKGAGKAPATERDEGDPAAPSATAPGEGE